MDPESGLAAAWVSYRTGDAVPEAAFIGGFLSPDVPLYVCRAPMNGVKVSGYFNPSTGLAYIHNGSIQYPTTVELLNFSPNGPTSVGPTAGWSCPRYHVQIASKEYEYIEHDGSNGMLSWAITSSTTYAVGKSSGVFSTIAKFSSLENWYYLVYGITRGGTTWGHLLKTSLRYQWEPFEAGSDIPYNAFQGAYSIENEPLYIVMLSSDRSIGSYNAITKVARIESHGIQQPTSVYFLTLSQPQGSRAWSDAGYNTHSGPITALRIQLDTTVTGIQCRFGAQWSHGFWSNDHAGNIVHIEFKTTEYIKGVNIGLSDTLNYLELFTNLYTYGPFGTRRGGKNISMSTRWGQVHHFSGYLRWDKNDQMFKTFSFAVHGESCD